MLKASANCWRQLAASALPASRPPPTARPLRSCQCLLTPPQANLFAQVGPGSTRALSRSRLWASVEGRGGPPSSASPTAAAVGEGGSPPPTPPEFCSGCGVRLQDSEPERVGFYQLPKGWGTGPPKLPPALDFTEDDESEVMSPNDEPAAAAEDSEEEWTTMKLDDFDLAVEDWLEEYESKSGKKKKRSKEVEEVKVDVSGWGGQDEEGEGGGGAPPPLFCARCYSLTHYGRVKSEAAESRLPDFDIGKKIGAKINLRRFRRSVVLAVVDVADFDGSLPRAALKALLPRDHETGGLRTPSDVDLVIAVNKVDLLPAEATATRLDQWVRRHCKQAGIPKPRAVHLVSSTQSKGVSGLLKDLGELVGSRGDVWVVGAQNSGKSSLINALRVARKKAEGARGKVDPKKLLTIAALPGTTLGMIPVNGIMPAGAQMFDTPGVPHPFQLTSILTGAESPGATLYLTIWASDELSTHLGRTEGAGALWGKHAGDMLVPPTDRERVEAIGRLEPHEVAVAGDSWTKSSGDIAIAGLGWVSAGLQGRAVFRVWVPQGVAVTTHESLLKQYAKTFCKPGFTLAVGGGTGKKKGGGKRGK
eukprot:jgi/Tetstr1/436238/TSEL_025082.t1